MAVFKAISEVLLLLLGVTNVISNAARLGFLKLHRWEEREEDDADDGQPSLKRQPSETTFYDLLSTDPNFLLFPVIVAGYIMVILPTLLPPLLLSNHGEWIIISFFLLLYKTVGHKLYRSTVM